MLWYIQWFFVYSFVGWILDTSYRSLAERKYSSGSFLPFLTPIYGFGGLALSFFFLSSPLSFGFDILFGTLLVVLLECIGGIFCLHVLQRRYWDYSHERGNFLGHISIVHSIYWFVLVAVFRALFPYLPL